jgi:redox-sensitive bicupin YhaK (pirin superfamily)
MANFPFYFRPKPGRFGNLPEIVSQSVGTLGVQLTASATVTVPLPTVSGRRFYVESVSIIGTVAAAGGGAVTVTVVNRKAGGGSDTSITAATSLTSTVITSANTSTNVPITASRSDRVINGTDVVKLLLTCASTITTQPTAQVVVQFVALD